VARLGSDLFRNGEIIDFLAFSADGRFLFTASHRAHHVHLWSVPDGRLVQSLDAGGPVGCLALSGDGRWLAAGADRGEMGHVVLWDAVQRKRRRILRPYRANSTQDVAFSADGDTLVTTSLIEVPEPSITVWDVAEGKQRAAFDHSLMGSGCLALSPNGQTLAVAWYSNIELRAVATGKLRCTLTSKRGQTKALAFSPNGRLLASGNDEGSVHLWNLSGGWSRHRPRLLRQLKGNTDPVHGLAFSPDGALLAVAAGDGVVIRQVDTGRKIRTLSGPACACCVGFSSDGTLIASGDARVHLWDSQTGGPRFTPTGHRDGIAAGSFSLDGRWIALADEAEQISLWDGDTFEERGRLTGECLAWSPDGLAWTGSQNDSRVRVWDPATGRERAAFPLRNVWLEGLALSPDGRTLAVWGHKPFLALYHVGQLGNARRLPTPRVLKGHRDMVDHVAFSHDGRWLVSTASSFDRDQTVRLWDVASGEQIRSWKDTDSDDQCTYEVQSVAFSADGRWLAWGDCGRVFLVDLGSDEPPRLFEEPRWGQTEVLRFAPNGQRLLAGGDGGRICVWDIAGGQIIRTLEGHRGGTTVLDFSPDGRRMLSAGGDCTALIWDAAQLV
jgi:WD40 repeat protein